MRYLGRLAVACLGTALMTLFNCLLIAQPVYAIQSATGWSRIVSQSSINAYNVAQRSLGISSIAANMAAAQAGQSVGLRVVAAAAGWPALGVVTGLTLLSWYYSAQQVQDVKVSAAPPGAWTVPGYDLQNAQVAAVAVSNCPGGDDCAAFSTFNPLQVLKITLAQPQPPTVGCASGEFHPGFIANWAGPFSSGNNPNGCFYYRSAGTDPQGVSAATQQPSNAANQTDIENWLNSLPSTDPNYFGDPSVHGTDGDAALQPSIQTTVAVGPDALPSTVVQSSTVTPDDVVVNPSAPAPSGTPDPVTAPTQSTTSTTVTNQDGSTTTTDDAIVQCSANAEHDQRTMGSILTAHMETWQSVGIAGTLNNLKNIVWPSTLPTISIGGGLLGSQNINFSAHQSTFDAVRAIMIAFASIAGVVIVFRGRATS